MLKHIGARKRKKGLGFSKISLKTPINLLIGNCYFNAGDLAIKQAIGIRMGADPAFHIPIKKNKCPQ